MSVFVLKNNFSRGEFSPKARSRVDLEMFGGGAETVRNFICDMTGGLRRRSGTRYAGSAKDTVGQCFLEFVFSAGGDAYILEFGTAYIRFWYSNGTIVKDAFNAIVEVASPYTLAEAEEIQFVQIGDTVYLAHEDHPPRKLVRNSHTSWTLSTLTFTDGPYLPINDTTTTVTASAAYAVGATTTLTFSSTTGVNSNAGFTASDIGRHIRVLPYGVAAGDNPGGGGDSGSIGTGGGSENIGLTNRWIFGRITGVTSTTQIAVNWFRIGDGVSAADAAANGAANGVFGTATSSWRLGAFGTTPGYPGCVTVFESRLTWARTGTAQRSIYFSRTGVPLDYAPSSGDSTVVADHGMYLDIIASKADRILWLKEAARLQVATPAGIRTVGGTDTSQPLSPTNVSQRLEVETGASVTPPASVGATNIFASRTGSAIHALYFDFNINGLTAPDISRLHTHLLSSNVKKFAFMRSPEPTIWVLKTDGTLFGITFDQQERIVGFHRHDFGNNAVVQSIGVIPNANRDMLWLRVDRTINGVEVHTVEYMEANFDEVDGILEDAFFVDCALTYNSTAINAVPGFTHLANTPVQVLADGSYKSGLTVSGAGVVTLPNGQTASKVHVGLGITSEFKTLRPAMQVQDGWSLGRKQSVSRVYVEVLRTSGLRIGTSSDSNDAIEHRRTDQGFDEPPDMKNGVYLVPVDDRRTGGGQVYGVVDTPHPAFIRSLLIQLDIEGAR